MKLTKNIEIIDLALLINKETLVLADIHIGYEEALNKQGLLVPRFQFKETEKRIKNILEKTKPRKIIINGDLKHEFGTISETEWRHTLKILDLFKDKEIILIKGNHDTILGPIANKKNLTIKDYYKINNMFICHGDKILDNINFSTSKIIIIAHEHPAIVIGTKTRKETYKCFLKGHYKNKTLIVQPSLNLVTEGTNILKEKLLSPFLHQNLNNFNVYIVSDKIYDFGKLSQLNL